MRGLTKWLGSSLLCLTVMGFATPAAAQDSPTAVLSAGYNYFQAKSASDEEWTKFAAGWYFDAAGNVTPMVSIVGQVTGNYKTLEDEPIKVRAHTFMVGVRGSSPGRVRGFGQVLVGAARLSAEDTVGAGFSASETDLAFQVGGGVDIMGGGPVGARVGLDYVRIQAKDDGEVLEGDSGNGLRFSVGVTFDVGSR